MSGDEPELEGPKGFRSRFNVWRNGNQGPYAQGAVNTIEWTDAEFDSLGEVRLVNPWDFRPRRAGYYLLHAAVQWILLANDSTQIFFRINGAILRTEAWTSSPTTVNSTAQATAILHLEAGDAVDVRTSWTNPLPVGNKNIWGNQVATYFMGHRLS
jgi:hypothetical protein